MAVTNDIDERLTTMMQMIRVLPDETVSALERIVWQMSDSNTRKIVKNSRGKIRLYISFNDFVQSIAIVGRSEVMRTIESLAEKKVSLIVYSGSTYTIPRFKNVWDTDYAITPAYVSEIKKNLQAYLREDDFKSFTLSSKDPEVSDNSLLSSSIMEAIGLVKSLNL